MPTSKSSSPAPQTTTRIRDNQRRSRARRKEYLSSLETKLSHCERVGVEASVEIQNAARKVLEENRRLRDLLRGFGVVEDGASGRVLEGLLTGGGRRRCGEGDGNGNGAVAMAMGSGCGSGSGRGRPIAIAPSAGVSPGSSSSNVTNATNYRPSPQANVAGPHIQPKQDLAMKDKNSPALNENANKKQLATIAPMPTFVDADYALDPELAAFPPPKPNCSSCKSVATAIRSIRPDIGTELEEDLGCQVDDPDCSVPNMMAFDVIDRYSDGRG